MRLSDWRRYIDYANIVVIYGIFGPLNYISALAIAACLTPTDPIICAAIVGTHQYTTFAHNETSSL